MELKTVASRLDAKWMVIILAVSVLVLFTVVPMLYLVLRSFFVDEVINFTNYRDVYSSVVNWRALINTFKLSFLVMGLSLVISFPLAWLVGRTNLPGKGFFRTLFIATYMIPPYVGAIAWVQLLNPSVGYLNVLLVKLLGLEAAPFNIYSEAGLVWVLTLFYSPFAFITISRALEKMDPTLEEAARVSGASPLKTLWDVTLPLMFPSILAGGLLVFIAAASCFGIPSIVGMPAGIEVLTTRIVTYVYMGDSKGIRDATALAVALMVISNAILLFVTLVLSKKEFVTISGKSTRPNIVDLGSWKWVAVAATTLYGIVAVVLPIGSIVITSMIKSLSRPIMLSNLTFDNWWLIFENEQYLEPIKNSFVSASIAATVATVLAMFVAYLLVKTNVRGRMLPDALATLGGATPSVVIALALIITFSGNFGLNLYSTVSILVVGYMVKYLTMAVRTIAASLSQVHQSLEEAALSSGAGWLRTFKDILLPLVSPSIVAGWFLVFMPSFYELTMSIILYGAKTKTIGVLLYELQTYADPQNASVLAVLVLAMVLGGNIVIRKLSKGNIGI